MKFTRIRLLIIIAISFIVIGSTGAAITYYTGLNEFFMTQSLEDYQRLNQSMESASRYTISEQAIATTPVTIHIMATGGTITVQESISNQIELDLHMPYQPNEKTVALLQRDGDTFTVDTATIWRTLAGNENQPIFDIDIRVPAGTSLDISNTVGDLALDGQLNAVTVVLDTGSIELRTADINTLDATFKVSGDITGEAAKSSTINVNVGSVDLHVSQPGTHTISASTGDIEMNVVSALNVAATYQITNGEFSSQVPNTTASMADVILNLTIENGDITISPR